MPFFHGIKVNEKQTQIVAPVQVDSAVQVVVGLAPVNMGSLADPLAPQIAYSYDEAVQKMGMSADHLTYTICESIKLSFANYNVSPLIMINVLDPSKHKEQKTSVSVSMLEGKAELPEEGVIPSSLQLTQTEQALQVGTDYNLSFDTDGKAVIERIEGGKIASDTASLTATYDVLDPTAVEDEDILECGIRIIAQPPGKKLQNMMQMSGGEKALTAIALLFAIQALKPSPFCLLDEIEAALDDSNVSRFASYLNKLTKNTQFIVITHRRGTMTAADRLYGITMQEKGVSTLVSVDLIEHDLN